jgi:hypothetical protein
MSRIASQSGFITHLRERLDLSSVTGSTLPGQEAKGAMARRFVLDDRRPTSVVSQGIYLAIKTDLTVAKRDVLIHHRISHSFK